MKIFDTSVYGNRIHNHFLRLGDLTDLPTKNKGTGHPTLSCKHINTMTCLLIGHLNRRMRDNNTPKVDYDESIAAPALIQDSEVVSGLIQRKYLNLQRLGLVDYHRFVYTTDLGSQIVTDYLDFLGVTQDTQEAVIPYLIAIEREFFNFNKKAAAFSQVPPVDSQQFLVQRMKSILRNTLYSLIESKVAQEKPLFTYYRGLMDGFLVSLFNVHVTYHIDGNLNPSSVL